MKKETTYIVREQQFDEIVKQKDKYGNLMKILIQTLGQFGYKAAAKTLQKQSGISYFLPDLEAFEDNLRKKEQYDEQEASMLGKLLLRKPTALHQQIHLAYLRLQMGQIVRNNSMEVEESSLDVKLFEKLERFNDRYGTNSQSFQNLVCQSIFDPQYIGNSGKNRQISELIKLFENSDIQKSSMQAIVQFYLQHKLSCSLTNLSQIQEFPFLEGCLPVSTELPKKMVEVLPHETKHQIIIVQMNEKGDRIVTAGVNLGSKETQLTMWYLDNLLKNKESRQSGSHTEIRATSHYIEQKVECIVWNHEEKQQQQLVGCISRKGIKIFDRSLKELSSWAIQDGLCCQFNPITNFLYSGGLNNHQLRIWGHKGQELDSVRVGPQRTLFFNQIGTLMYLVSASGNIIKKYDTVENNKLAQRKMPSAILDCKLRPDGTKLLVCLKQQLYILNEHNFDIVQAFELEDNKSQVQYYMYVRCYGPWYIVSNQKYFKAFHMQAKGKTTRWSHQAKYPTYDLKEGGKIQMVSTKGKRLCIWALGAETIIIDDEENHETNSEHMTLQPASLGDEEELDDFITQ